MAAHWSDTRLITFCNPSDSSAPPLVSHLLKKYTSYFDDMVPYPSVSVSPDSKSFQLDVQIDGARAEDTEILHFSRSLSQACFEANRDGNQHLLLSLLSIMLGGFLKTRWPSTILLDEPFVALPKHPVKGYDPLVRVSSTGKVTRLVLFAYEEHLGSDDGANVADDYEVEAASPPTPGRSSASEFCARDQWGRRSPLVLISEGSGSKSSVYPLSETGTELDSPTNDFFFQGSILTGRYTALNLMGLICAGTSESLWGTMASMLYQRRSWGIEEPVFGILLRHGSTKVAATVSWLSKEVDPGNLPCVNAANIAHYDLSSPAESFAFARLLRGLGDHVSDVQTLFGHAVRRWNTENMVPGFLSWRADTYTDPCIGEDYTSEPAKAIQTWLSGICCLNSPGDSTMDDVDMRGRRGEHHEEKPHPPITHLSSLSYNSQNNQTSIGGEQRYSCSEFCQSEASVAKWLGQRNIFPMIHPFGEIDGLKIPGECTSQHTVDYDNWTALPRDSLQTMLKSANVSEQRLSEELEFLKNCLDEPKLLFVSSENMNPAVRSNIESHLDALLRISIYAYDKMANGATLNISEGRLRVCWDALIALSLISDESSCKIESSANETIQLPLNKNFAALNVARRGRMSNTIDASGYTKWKNLISSTWDSPSTVVDDLQETYEGSGRYLPLRVYNDLEDEGHAKRYDWVTQMERLQVQFDREPLQARVDGIVTLSVPMFQTAQDCRRYGQDLRDLAFVVKKDCEIDDSPTSHIGYPKSMEHAVENGNILQSTRRQTILDRPRHATPSSSMAKSKNLQSSKSQATFAPVSPFDPKTMDNGNSHLEERNPSESQVQTETRPALTGSEVSDSERDTGNKTAGTSLRSDVGDHGIIRLPVILQENKRSIGNMDSAVNQGRLDIAAALEFLASLGVYDHSVYAIVTNGVFGLLCYGFMEKQMNGKAHKHDMGLIFQHNTRLFDISSPVDVFNLAIAIGNICTKNGANLRAKFVDVAGDLRQDFEFNMHSKYRWTLVSQIKAMKPTSPSS